MVLWQTLIMGAMAGSLALPLGWLMSEVLVHVLNVRSFGWRMSTEIAPQSILDTLLLAILSATLAGLYPAWRLSRQHVVQQLRDE